jgi:hypothetical protein
VRGFFDSRSIHPTQSASSQKVPVQEDGIWTQKMRYTFKGMDFDIIN